MTRRRISLTMALSCVATTIVVPAVDPVEQLDDVEAGGGVEVAGGLVGQQDLRLVDDGAGDRDALLLTTAQLVREALCPCRPGPPSRGSPAPGCGSRAAACRSPEGEGDVLRDRLAGQQTEVLEDRPHLATQTRDLAGGHLPQFVTRDHHHRRSASARAGDAHEGGLAGAGFADDEREFAPGDLQGDVVECRSGPGRISWSRGRSGSWWCSRPHGSGTRQGPGQVRAGSRIGRWGRIRGLPCSACALCDVCDCPRSDADDHRTRVVDAEVDSGSPRRGSPRAGRHPRAGMPRWARRRGSTARRPARRSGPVGASRVLRGVPSPWRSAGSRSPCRH